jgi:hypothetical protein
MRYLLLVLLLTGCGAPMATGVGQGIGVAQGTLPPWVLTPPPQPVRAVQCFTFPDRGGSYTVCH